MTCPVCGGPVDPMLGDKSLRDTPVVWCPRCWRMVDVGK